MCFISFGLFSMEMVPYRIETMEITLEFFMSSVLSATRYEGLLSILIQIGCVTIATELPGPDRVSSRYYAGDISEYQASSSS